MAFVECLKFGFVFIFYIICNPIIFISNHKKRNIALSKVLEGCGPAFIKFAQLLSTRPDIVGDKLARDLQILQDRLLPFNKNNIDKIFFKNYRKLPNEIFLEFDYNSIAAASIAQVHKAKLMNGEICAIKILRPKIKERIEKNINLLTIITNFIDNRFEKFKRFRLPEIIKMLRRNLLHETDLTFEGASASQMKLNLEKDKGVYVPEIHWNLTRVDILVMEWVDGVPLNRLKDSEFQHINRRLILQNLVNTFCNQVYRDGVFHADMHPGNVMIDGFGRILLTDFGIVGRMDKKTKFYVTEILRGFLKNDYKLVARIHFEAGYVDKNYSILEFENACRALGKQIVGKNISEISIGTLFTGLLRLTNDFNMSTRLELLLIQKATVLLEGVSSFIDKDVNLWELSDQWLRNHYMTFDKVLKLKFNNVYRKIIDEIKDLYLF
jgi:ubiquinone biosynthesis protein